MLEWGVFVIARVKNTSDTPLQRALIQCIIPTYHCLFHNPLPTMSTERKPLIAIGIEGSANKVSPFPCHSRTVWSGDYPKQRNALRDSIEHQKDIHIASGNGIPSP